MSILDYYPILSQQKKSIKPMLPGDLMSILITPYEITPETLKIGEK